MLPFCHSVNSYLCFIYPDFSLAGPQPPELRLLTSPMSIQRTFLSSSSWVLTFLMFFLLRSALAYLLPGTFPEWLIISLKLVFGGCRVQGWSQMPSLLFIATNEHYAYVTPLSSYRQGSSDSNLNNKEFIDQQCSLSLRKYKRADWV